MSTEQPGTATSGPIAWSYDLSIKPSRGSQSTSTTSPISLINYVQTIDLTHSLFQKCMTLELVLLDASLLFNPLTISDLINQRAALYLTIRTANGEQALITEREFRVLEVKEGTATVGLTARQHRIIAADPIAVRNLNAYVSDAYDTNQVSIADIGKSIFDRYLSERREELTVDESKALTTSTTTSPRQLIFPYVRPFHAMDMCARLARSIDDATTGGDLWMFFQTPAGVLFRCLRKIIDEQLENPPHTYVLQPDSMRTGDPARDAYRIEHFKQLQLGSYPALARAGASRAGLSEFNIITGDVTTTLYAADDSGATQLSSSAVRSDDVESPTHIRVQSDLAAYGFNESADRDKYNITTVQKAMLSQSSLNVQVRGNVALKAGDLIRVEAPMIAGVSRSNQLDPHLSGLYLITTVKHLIPNSQDFITVMDLVREGSDIDESAPSVVAEDGDSDSVIYDVNGNRVS